MGLRPLQYSPNRHVQARPARQWPIVKVDSPKRGPCNQGLRQNRQVGHGKQPLKGDITQIGGIRRAKMWGALCLRPSRNLRIGCDHTAQPAAGL